MTGARLLAMVGVLHDRGHQRLRITPAIAPTGLHWRLSVTAEGCPEVARYTSGDGDTVYGWPESPTLSPTQLADLFVERFPALVAAGSGDDPGYAAWMRQVVDLAGQDLLPYFHADWELEDDGFVPLCSPTRSDRQAWPSLPWPPD